MDIYIEIQRERKREIDRESDRERENNIQREGKERKGRKTYIQRDTIHR